MVDSADTATGPVSITTRSARSAGRESPRGDQAALTVPSVVPPERSSGGASCRQRAHGIAHVVPSNP